MSLKYRSSYLSKIMRTPTQLWSRLRRLMKRQLRKSNLRKLMTTHSNLQIQHLSRSRFLIKKSSQLKSPLNSCPTKRKQKKFIK
jgi:hypothetical protein